MLYLYREFQSESIRFLMPEAKFWTPQGLHSFIAALQLGLKRKFGGEIDHLQTLISEEPQPNSTLRKSFLYLYDSVPGGTGYLRQLIRQPDELKDVFDHALAVLRACGCEDGCYSCLFAYRNSFDQDQTSRKCARDLLGAIAKHWPQLAETSEGLAAIRLNSNFESELERRFIEALRRYDGPITSGNRPQLRKDILNGRPGYYLKIGDIAWTIETQVSLGPDDGVAIPSRADFVIRPASSRIQSRAIAIFTDGWDYHKDRISEDFQQRLAIQRSGQYLTWSLTWDDIAAQLEPNFTSSRYDGLACQLNPQFLQGRAQFYEQYACTPLQALEPLSSFEWLIRYLAAPSVKQWQRWAMLRSLAQADPTSLQTAGIQQQWSDQLRAQLSEALDYWDPPERFMTAEVTVSDALKIYSAVDMLRHKQQDATGSFVLLLLDDTPTGNSTVLKSSWVEALRLLNLYQFLPHNYARTTNTIPSLLLPRTAAIRPDVIVPNPQWEELIALVLEDDLLPAIDQMQQAHWPFPEAGYELANQQGTVVAIAELAWAQHRIAITATASDQNAFQAANWSAIDPTQLLNTFNAIGRQLTDET